MAVSLIPMQVLAVDAKAEGGLGTLGIQQISEKKYAVTPDVTEYEWILNNASLTQQMMGHVMEIKVGKGGQMVRSAGASAQLMAKEGDYALLRLPSGELRRVHICCRATIGTIGNEDHENITLGKAGRNRWLGVRPANRGVSMNPNDHPHGGGEGKSPVGRKRPVTPWGKPAYGVKTRDNRKASTKLIVKRRK